MLGRDVAICKLIQVLCLAGRQEVGRCNTRGEYQGMCNMYKLAKHEQDYLFWLWNTEETSPEVQIQRCQLSHKKELCPKFK